MKPAYLSQQRLIAVILGFSLSAAAFAEKYDVDVWNSGATAARASEIQALVLQTRAQNILFCQPEW